MTDLNNDFAATEVGAQPMLLLNPDISSTKFDLTVPTNQQQKSHHQSLSGLSAIDRKESLNLSPSEGMSPNLSKGGKKAQKSSASQRQRVSIQDAKGSRQSRAATEYFSYDLAMSQLQELRDNMKRIVEDDEISTEEKISEINELIISEGEGTHLMSRWLDIINMAMEKASLDMGFEHFFSALGDAIALIAGQRPADKDGDHNNSFLNDSMHQEEKAIVVQVDKILSQAHSTQVAGDWLKKNPGYKWKGVWRQDPTRSGNVSLIEVYKVQVVDLNSVSNEHRTMLDKLTMHLNASKEKIEIYLRGKKGLSPPPSIEVARDITQIIPVRIVKLTLLNQEDSFADQMKSLQTMKTQHHKKAMQNKIIELFGRFLEANRGGDPPTNVLDFDCVATSLKQALCSNPEDSYEFQELDKNEQIKEAELEGLDDFLLQNQDQDEDPSLLNQLQETIRSYQTLIEEHKYKSEAEKVKILNLIETLSRQVEQVKRDQAYKKKYGKARQPEEHGESYLDFETQRYNPLRNGGSIRSQDMSQEMLQKHRERVLANIFDFYARQQLSHQKGATFDAIKNDFHSVNLVKFVRFCIDFLIPVPKLQVSQIFRRVSPNNHDLTFDQFKEMIEKLFAEVNRLKGHDLKKRLKRGGMTEEETTEAKQQMHDIKNKTREEIIEEAYTYLELDNLQRVENKKKGVQMNFITDGHPGFKSTAQNAEVTQNIQSKVKLRNFTDEQKVEIRERVKQIKFERESFMNPNNPHGQHRFTQKRKLLKSGGSTVSRPQFQQSNMDEQSHVAYLDNTGMAGLGQRNRLDSNTKSMNPPSMRQVNKLGTTSQNPISSSVTPMTNQFNAAKHILTLQKLSNIQNYQELNSKSDDDFHPAQFGFDANPPVPEKLLNIHKVGGGGHFSHSPTEEDMIAMGSPGRIPLKLPNANLRNLQKSDLPQKAPTQQIMLSSGIIPPGSNRLNAINKMNTVGGVITKPQKLANGGNILTIDQDPLSQFKPLNNSNILPLGLGNKRGPPPTLPQAVPITSVVANNRQKNFGTQGVLMLTNGEKSSKIQQKSLSNILANTKPSKSEVVEVWKNPLHDKPVEEEANESHWKSPSEQLTMANRRKKPPQQQALMDSHATKSTKHMSSPPYNDSKKTLNMRQNSLNGHEHLQQQSSPPQLELPPIPTPYNNLQQQPSGQQFKKVQVPGFSQKKHSVINNTLSSNGGASPLINSYAGQYQHRVMNQQRLM
ncbi:hypothetical protein FGO68_gene10543 [Halteria grandinella]|uniref:Uncharacterized protein n=1 Tax=Halteria grandinella TaxID=5974 RepID=A0A8J8P1P5_HALGN|nr:hypothetical protein FGO68_gene10543 [Halteria grandinella]